MRYGYIDKSGVLQAKDLKEKKEPVPDGNGKIIFKITTVEQQVEDLSKQGWKPFDDFEEGKCKCDEGYIVDVYPFDNGDRISYRYEKVINKNYYQKKLDDIKKDLDKDDYKITKAYEYSLVGKELPYDVVKLHEERQAKRDEINRLKAIINNLNK